MTSTDILRNVHYFFTVILKDIHLKQNLNEESVEKAFKWATYCTEVYKSCKGRQLENQFNDALNEIFTKDPNWIDKPVDISMLQNSYSLLRTALLRNPHLSNKTFDIVLRAYSDNYDDLIQECKKLAKHKFQVELRHYLSSGLNDVEQPLNSDLSPS